jgi:hypothetical protein
MDKNNNIIVAVLIISIIGQAVSYFAVDKILERVTNPTQIIVTVSGNDSDTVETETQTGQIGAIEREVIEIPTEEIQAEYGAIRSEFRPSGVLSAASGVNYFGQQKETYYNLPMDGVISWARIKLPDDMKDLEYTVRADGCKMFGDYIIIAANQTVHPYGSLVETSLGTGIVLDTGGFALTNPNQVDIAVNW